MIIAPSVRLWLIKTNKLQIKIIDTVFYQNFLVDSPEILKQKSKFKKYDKSIIFQATYP